MIVKGFLEYSFAVSVDKKFIVKKQRRDRGTALTVTDWWQPPAWTLQPELEPMCWPLTVKVEV